MKRILFADHYEFLARISCEVLRLHGYEAEFALSPQAVLQMLDSKGFDVIVLDAELSRTDGNDLKSRIGELHSSVAIISVVKGEATSGQAATNAIVHKEELFPALIEAIDQADSPHLARRAALASSASSRG
jgi:CheY-like chemotaxis protein